MKTIEEKAQEVGMLSQVRSDYLYDKRSVEFGYTQGAIEQKAIDKVNYKQGYHDAIKKACEWITEHINIPYEGEFVDNSSVASDYIEWCEKRLEVAKEITDEFRKAMEE